MRKTKNSLQYHNFQLSVWTPLWSGLLQHGYIDLLHSFLHCRQNQSSKTANHPGIGMLEGPSPHSKGSGVVTQVALLSHSQELSDWLLHIWANTQNKIYVNAVCKRCIDTPLIWNECLCIELCTFKWMYDFAPFIKNKRSILGVHVSIVSIKVHLSVVFSASWSLLPPFLSSLPPVELLTRCILFPTSCQETSPNRSLQKLFRGQGIRDTAEVRPTISEKDSRFVCSSERSSGYSSSICVV